MSKFAITSAKHKIWLYKYPIDMRKQIDSLTAYYGVSGSPAPAIHLRRNTQLTMLIAEKMNMNPQNGDIFVFFSYAADRMKLLTWDGTGFVLIYKRLEVGYFSIPQYIGNHIELNNAQLRWLFRGTGISNCTQAIEYSEYF